MKDKVDKIIKNQQTKIGLYIDYLIQFLILLSIISFTVETLPGLDQKTIVLLNTLELVSVIIFSLEYLIRIYTSDKKLKFIFSFYGIIDLLAILPFYLSFGFDLRSAQSFLRFGNFELFAARNDVKNLKILTNYTIKNHFSHLGSPCKEVYLKFFKEVTNKTLDMIIHWQRVGFVHGVMNTDNMSILGLTIDYGPYGWLEGFDVGWTPNTTDKQHKRYRYGNQPTIGLWNLYQLANALYPLIDEAAPLEEILEGYKSNFAIKSQDMMRNKLGLVLAEKTDINLIQSLENNLQVIETDMTIFFRLLSSFKKQQPEKGVDLIQDAFYTPEQLVGEVLNNWKQWFLNYAKRLEKETLSCEEREQLMKTTNPKYVLRNYMAQMAIDKAEKDDVSLIDELYEVLKKPYEEQPEFEHWFTKRPEWARHKVGCSMLSCSS